MAVQPVRVIVQLENLKGNEQGLSVLRHYTDPFSFPPGSFHNEKQINKKTHINKSTPIKIVNKVKKENETTVSVDISPNLMKYSNLENLLSFDVVGTEYDHSVQNEYERINARLFQEKRDCALIEIKAQRWKCPVRELAKILVSNVATQLMLLQTFDVQKIELEYCDLRKYEAVGMLGTRNGFKNVKNTVQFVSILMLLKWLNTDFQRHWMSAHNNDVIDLQYTLVNNLGVVQQYRLSIIYLYLSKMDIWTRMELDGILRNVKVKKNQVNKRQTILSDCLREYFHKNSQWNVWICFRIPTYLQTSTNIAHDMLQMAVGVYKKTHNCASETSINNKTSNNSQLSILFESRALKNEEESTASTRIHGGNENNSSKRSLPSFIFNTNSNSRLSYWYYKIDEQARDVIKTMREYYMQKMKSSLKKVNQDISISSHLLITSSEKNISSTSKILDKTEDKVLHQIHEKFSLSYETFLKIKKDCMSSNKYNLILEYYNTKKEQIVQEECKLLRIFIRNCHENLCSNLKEQL